MFEFIVWNSPIIGSHKRNIDEIFGFAVHNLFDVQGYGVMGLRDYGVIVLRIYGVKELHVLRLIWLWGYRYIEFSGFSNCFLRLGRNLWRAGIKRNLVSAINNTWENHSRILRTEIFFLWACVIISFFDTILTNIYYYGKKILIIWDGMGFMLKIIFGIFIKSLRFETPWVRKIGFCKNVCM